MGESIMVQTRHDRPAPAPNPAALEFLLTRRSRPARTLVPPVPDRAALSAILTAGARCPDHGKLEPWRFIVLERKALLRLAGLVVRCAARLGLDADATDKMRCQFADSHLAVVVVSSPKPSEKVPEIEQHLSAGAVCLSILNATLASGWGANWLTGWPAFDRTFLREGLRLGSGEFVAGFIHIGTGTTVPPERPRPDMEAITEWVAE